VLSHLLRRAGAGEPLSPPAEAAEARADVRRRVGESTGGEGRPDHLVAIAQVLLGLPTASSSP
jgi:hypothetical protein